MRFLVMMRLFPHVEKGTGKLPVPGLLLFLANQVGFEVGEKLGGRWLPEWSFSHNESRACYIACSQGGCLKLGSAAVVGDKAADLVLLVQFLWALPPLDTMVAARHG